MHKGPSLRFLAALCVVVLFLAACTVYAAVIHPSGNILGAAQTAAERPASDARLVLSGGGLSEEPDEWPSPPPAPAKEPAAPAAPSPSPSGRPPAFFLPENQPRYQAFMEKETGIPYETALAYVNASVDLPHYGCPTELQNPDDILAMCNKTYCFPEGYTPPDLVSIPGKKGALLRAEAAGHYKEMADEMLAAGLQLYPISAYRGYGAQKSLYQKYVSRSGAERTDTYSARPGHSEHQGGLTLDVLQGTGYSSMSKAGFQETGHYKWLCAHAHEYGFILRYPEGYESVTGYIYEPWHWRYIGIEAATQMKTEGIATLEEYTGRRGRI